MLKKIFNKMNIIDILILFLALTAAASIIYRLTADRAEVNTGIYEITAVCDSCPKAAAMRLSEGSEFFSFETRKRFGTVKTLDSQPFADGVYDLTVTIRAKAKPLKPSKNGIDISGTVCLIGKYINLTAEDAIFTVRIDDITKAEQP